jgi:hypothetical protein
MLQRKRLMLTRVIIHKTGKAGSDGYDVYVQGREQPYRRTALAAINDLIAELEIISPQVLGSPVCMAERCLLAATGTIIWATPGDGFLEYAAQCACDEHLKEFRASAVSLDVGCFNVEDVINLPQAAYRSTSGWDMESLTRALVNHSVPAAVFPQPCCSRCKARLRTTGGRDGLEWVTADGGTACTRRSTKHAVTKGPVTDAIVLSYRPSPPPAPAGRTVTA